ncbi:MAG: hypothetical protein K8J31_28305, partial [Anaerolineae bacterium]|nr:hypothetical protein [Anaerolineae bacterium]
FMLFMLFHTGLWIPLLIGGLIFWGIRQHRRQDGGMWEKRKWGDWQPEDEPEKTKHSDYI